MAAVCSSSSNSSGSNTNCNSSVWCTYLVYIVCIIKRVWAFISLATSSSLTTQLTTDMYDCTYNIQYTMMPDCCQPWKNNFLLRWQAATVVESFKFPIWWKLEPAGAEVEAALLERHETRSSKETSSKMNTNFLKVLLQKLTNLKCKRERKCAENYNKWHNKIFS